MHVRPAARQVTWHTRREICLNYSTRGTHLSPEPLARSAKFNEGWLAKGPPVSRPCSTSPSIAPCYPGHFASGAWGVHFCPGADHAVRDVASRHGGEGQHLNQAAQVTMLLAPKNHPLGRGMWVSLPNFMGQVSSLGIWLF